MKLSQIFVEQPKLANKPRCLISNMTNIHPALLSKWVIGAQSVRVIDERLIQIGKLIGLSPSEVFETLTSDHNRQGGNK